MNELIVTGFNIINFMQVFFWWWLYDQKWLKFTFNTRTMIYGAYGGLMILFGAVNGLGLNIGYYSQIILSVYIVLYGWCLTCYDSRFDWVEAFALTGLTVYFNSYYWEIVLHIQEFNQLLRITPNMALQMVHLLPALFFVRRFEYDKDQVLSLLSRGVLISGVVAVISIALLTKRAQFDFIPLIYRIPFKSALFALNRFACLNILIQIVCNSKKVY